MSGSERGLDGRDTAQSSSGSSDSEPVSAVQNAFQLLFANSVDALVMTDGDGRILDSTQRASEVTGWPRTRILASQFRDVAPGAPAALLHPGAPSCGSDQKDEFRLVRSIGDERVISYTICRVGPDRYLTQLRDVTDQNRLKWERQFLSEASSLLGSSLDYQITLRSVAALVVPRLADWCLIHLLNDAGMLELVTVVHLDPAKIDAARESARRYPPRPDEPGGLSAVARNGKSEWLEDITEDVIRQTAQDEEHYRMLSEAGMTSYLCAPLIAHGGTLGTLTFIAGSPGKRYSARSLSFAEELARRAAIAVDNSRLYAAAQQEIQERVRTELALQESRDYYRTLTEAIPQLAWTTGPDGVADYYNQNWFDYTGLICDGTTYQGRNVVHSEDLANAVKRWQVAMDRSEPYEVEFRIRRRDGAYRWFLARGLPLMGANGDIVKWFGTCTDIDESKRAQIEIAALNARLRRAVQETHHRVKNNLQIVSALVDIQLEDEQDTVPMSALARIGQHARAMAAIHELMTHEARSDSVPDGVSTTAVLERLLPLIESTMGGRRIRFRLDDFQLGVSDSASLAMLVYELVSNAIKHGGNDIELNLTAAESTACLEVNDNGPGFAADFDWQTAANTGLGLIDSAARYDLQGTISYENGPRGGGCVIVRFPLPSQRSAGARQ